RRPGAPSLSPPARSKGEEPFRACEGDNGHTRAGDGDADCSMDNKSSRHGTYWLPLHLYIGWYSALRLGWVGKRAAPNIRARAIQAGVICFLPKPFDESDLLNCIQTALDRAKGNRSAP